MSRPVVVIGAGVAGASVAYFLGRAGVPVTVVDAGEHTASHVPSALVNPVRGQSGGVDPQALAGVALTWALLRDLAAQGLPIPHSQSGVLRPVPDERTRARFEKNLPPALVHDWLSPARVSAPLAAGWAHVLSLPQGGWLEGAALCRALLAASGAEVVRGRARAWAAQSVTLDSGDTWAARSVVWCGGSVGATWAGLGAGLGGPHRMGTLLTLDRAPGPVPLSFGAYLAPAAQGGVLGATFEAPSPRWTSPHLPLASLGWLLGKGAALTDLSGLRVTGQWTGTRLSGLRAGRGEDGVWHLSGLGSKGFLLGPLLAQGLAAEVSASLASRAG
ncbi:NAD(P)/FAD-dependent oxidoreductase [Deinococcus hohokamensis]|uniref:NAD(P)/FAD-dependent oxidoreductase n=1 Tax=Deinococcus hohokamensis TaxID=309883 RepID=A0ABV9IAV8_9DEIO